MGQQTSCCNGRELLRANGSALIAGVISGEACMKVIGAATGTDGIAKNSGAIYRATNDYPTYQSYILDMGSLRLVANFGPTDGNPPQPASPPVQGGNAPQAAETQ